MVDLLSLDNNGIPFLPFSLFFHDIENVGPEVPDILLHARWSTYSGYTKIFATYLICWRPFTLLQRLVENAGLRCALEAESTVIVLTGSQAFEGLRDKRV